MSAYLITTLNPEYSGKTFGLKFHAGKAVLSEEMLDKRLGYSVDDVVRGLRDFPGYTISPLSNVAQRALEAVLEAEAAGVQEPANKEGDEAEAQAKAKAASKSKKE